MSAFTDDLRRLADHLDKHPDLDVFENLTIYSFPRSATAFAEQVRALGGSIANPVVKSAQDDRLRATLNISDEIEIVVSVPKELTCERVQVGTTTVTRPKVIDTGETETVEEPVFEWTCPPAFVNASSTMAKDEADAYLDSIVR